VVTSEKPIVTTEPVFEMEITRLPIWPVPIDKAAAQSHTFLGFAQMIRPGFPELDLTLRQAKVGIDAEVFLSIACYYSFRMTIMLLIAFEFFAFQTGSEQGIVWAPIIAILLGCFHVMYQAMYPKLLVIKKVKALERNLLFALRAMLIQVNSGISLYHSLALIASGEYGLVSEEFNKAITRINAGIPEEEVLMELAMENPSMFFRRAIWQIANAVTAGSDVSHTLREIIKTLSKEQGVQLRAYGSQLNPMALMYMMIAVILPSLGVTFMIVLSGLPSVNVSEIMFWLLYAGVALFQFMFMGMIKQKRPSLLG